AFSRSGLIQQLKYEGYSRADASFAADAVHADWNEQAGKAAEEYLSMTWFSRSGLIQQLMYDGYTRSQAEHGASQAGL
ncbi:MAG TPA: Ltp family lipoprotein, partial [Nocardioidaceae bacterium]|nr:Ltp family lipoprotein [Nocardioidaceae bacterium]